MNVSKSVTLIITTSPTPSAPSTQLLTAVFESFRRHCSDLLRCKVIVVFDTYDSIATRARLKKGQVTAEGAASFELYKTNVKQLVLAEFSGIPIQGDPDLTACHGEAEFGFSGHTENIVPFSIQQTSDQGITFIEPKIRLGFGLAVRTALRLTTTPYVWVHQHDWTLVSDIPLISMISAMQKHEHDAKTPIGYIGLPSVRSLQYAVQTDTLRFPALHTSTKQLKQSFTPSSGQEDPLPLTPLFFWPDKPHIALTSHYLKRVFSYRQSIGRGDFIEDTVGQAAREEMKKGDWHKWATWLYYPDDGRQSCLRHLDGRVWHGIEGEEQKRLYWREVRRKENLARDRSRSIHRRSEFLLDALVNHEQSSEGNPEIEDKNLP